MKKIVVPALFAFLVLVVCLVAAIISERRSAHAHHPRATYAHAVILVPVLQEWQPSQNAACQYVYLLSTDQRNAFACRWTGSEMTITLLRPTRAQCQDPPLPLIMDQHDSGPHVHETANPCTQGWYVRQ